MLASKYEGQNCSIARALEAVGERWTLLIVRELLIKPRRFLELEKSLAIAKNTLTSRLEKLVDLGIVEKIAVEDPRDWSTYQLTRKGRDLFPVLSALMAWGDAYYAPRGSPAIFQHTCGNDAGHKLVCEACGDLVNASSVQGLPGPGWIRRSRKKHPA